ncbi:hypothetical protein AJ78_07925 [Emergomyces pasteurianus Ep9510]|uniref:Uncharacterized protein n=1 Tax=Emergomyces pasteurianus Ep9510 TaxID=1447872 RepID=A0A1J9P4G9_9EURO|nr:hypothetical protein AJ78_07925 [Emergomyces pasteurianus Ep9510]
MPERAWKDIAAFSSFGDTVASGVRERVTPGGFLGQEQAFFSALAEAESPGTNEFN